MKLHSPAWDALNIKEYFGQSLELVLGLQLCLIKIANLVYSVRYTS